MIDKLDVRVPARAAFSHRFGMWYRDVRGSKEDPFRSDQHYERTADLRPYGHDAILHLSCKHGERPGRFKAGEMFDRAHSGSHKIEILDAGTKTLREMRQTIERVFDLPAERLKILRLDVAADVEGVPVTWFEKHARVAFKRFTWDHQNIPLARMGQRGGIETVYFGKRPNCLRIYNKIEEWRSQHFVKLLTARRRSYNEQLHDLENLGHLSPDGEPPTIEELCGPAPDFKALFGYEPNAVLTRVERQMGSKLPEALDHVKKLRDNLPEFNPWSRVRIVRPGAEIPTVEKLGFERYCMVQTVLSEIEHQGLHRARAWLYQVTNKHADRVLRYVRPYLPANIGIDERRLYELYAQSTERQLKAA